MMSVGIFLTYPLVMYPAVEILLPVIYKVFKTSSGKSELVLELGFRYMLVAITCKYILGLFVGPCLQINQRQFTNEIFLIIMFLIILKIIVGLAAAIPKIDLFISLIGAVSSSTLALIAPSIIHTIVFWEDFEGISGKLRIGRNIFLFVLGIVGMVAGTITSVTDIVKYFTEPQEGGNFPTCP